MQSNFKIYTILAKAKRLDKTFADDRLVIRRGVVLFRIKIFRLADDPFDYSRETASAGLGLANLRLCLLSAVRNWNYSAASLEILIWNETKL